MAWPAYSETFLYVTGLGVTGTYTVPEHKRAIITSICARSYVAGVGLNVKVHGRILCVFNFPAASTTQNLELRCVAYQRQTISAYTGSDELGVHVSGFLVDDPSDATGPPGLVIHRRDDGLEVLPADLAG